MSLVRYNLIVHAIGSRWESFSPQATLFGDGQVDDYWDGRWFGCLQHCRRRLALDRPGAHQARKAPIGSIELLLADAATPLHLKTPPLAPRR